MHAPALPAHNTCRYPGCQPGFYGGEDFVALWDWKSRKLRGRGTDLIDGNSTAEDMLILTPGRAASIQAARRRAEHMSDPDIQTRIAEFTAFNAPYKIVTHGLNPKKLSHECLIRYL
jgi:hypothetical protein